MTHILPKEPAQPSLKTRPKLDFDAYVNKTIRIAREFRKQQASFDEAQGYLQTDFNALIRKSGRWLLINDVLALCVAFICGGIAAWLVHETFSQGTFQKIFSRVTMQQFLVFFSFGAIGLFWLDSRSHYRQRLPYWESVGDLLKIAVFGFLANGFIEFATRDTSSRLWTGLSWLFFFSFAYMGRGLVRHHLHNKGLWQIPALIVGKGPQAQKIRHALADDKQMGFAVSGEISPVELDDLVKPEDWKYLLNSHEASHIFIALSGSEMEDYQPALKAMARARVPCSIVPPWLGLPSSTLSPHHFMMQDIMLLHDTNQLQLRMPCALKRFFDLSVATVGIVVASPIMLLVALGVSIDGGSPFFKQKRVGKNGLLFDCYKFRSMRANAESILEKHLEQNPEAAEEWRLYQKLKNDVRITKFGQFIRRTSLDELPQLFNVIKGDMSLVGPRPCMPGQENLYDEDFSFYKSVRPGITGPWQVSGRNELTFEERVLLEAWYARNWNLWMDIVIMLKTVPAVLGRDKAF